MRHSGTLGIALGKVHDAVGHVAAKNENILRPDFGSARFVQQLLPQRRLMRQQPLKGETALPARRDAACHLGSLDHDRAAATARVVQRLTGLWLPAAGSQYGRSQGFLERSVALVLPPATLEQWFA